MSHPGLWFAVPKAARYWQFTGDFDAAKREYERSLALQPGVQAYAGLGRIHFEARAYQQALGAYEAALAIDDTRADLRAYAGLTHGALGNRDAARAAFEHALRLDPNEATASEGLAQLRPAP